MPVRELHPSAPPRPLAAHPPRIVTDLPHPQAGSTIRDFNYQTALEQARRSARTAMRFFLAAGLDARDGAGPARFRIYRPGERTSESTSSSPSPWLDGSRLIRLDFHRGISDAFRLDIVAHEYAHGVVERFITSRSAEANALNEALADVFAVAIEDRDESVDGRLLMTGDAFWSLAQVARARIGSQDNHGEHLMMGIATRPAAYVLRSCNRSIMARIYLDAMTRYMTRMPHSFAGFAAATLLAAAARFGTSSPAYRSLRAGWNSTGLSQTEIARRLPPRAAELIRSLP